MKARRIRELRDTEAGEVAEQQGGEEKLLPTKYSQPKSSRQARQGSTERGGCRGKTREVDDVAAVAQC